MLKIDAHNHPDFCGMSFEKLLANMDENGIEKVCLFPLESPWEENYIGAMAKFGSPLSAEVPIPFSRCLAFYEKAPDRFLLGYAPDPRKPEALCKMAAAIDTYGVKMCGEIKFRMMYDNPDIIELFRYCGQRGLPVTLHFDYVGASAVPNGAGVRKHYWYGGDIFTLERVLELCPETNFLSHAPGFWGCISNSEQWKTQAYPTGPVIPGGHVERLLDKFDNLYCDCSGGSGFTALSRDIEYTKALIMKHPDRFLFARDGFDNKLDALVQALQLSKQTQELFYHGNFERLIANVR